MDLGIDVGGTFTDLAAIDGSGSLTVLKVPSVPSDQSVGILAALEALGNTARQGRIVHGTTVATNAILERKGARCGLIATRGFRDVLELRRRDRPSLYGLSGWFEPLIPRDLRLEVTERIDHRGNIVEPLAEEEVRQAARRLADTDVIVISFLHAYANPAHERRAREVVLRELPTARVVLASDVLPEYREFERTSTAVVNGYVQPVVASYLQALSRRLAARGYERDVLIVQSNGGVMSSDVAQRLPVNAVLSGPAAGVIAGARIAAAAGFPSCITADVGGTSFDVSLVADGRPVFAEEMQVEYGVPVRTPHIDISTIGAGGGSIAWIDRGGLLHVGPQSAAADPGPAAYGRGWSEPTVTDAQLVLGRINPRRPIGGASSPELDVGLAREAVKRIARPLGVDVEQASLAILQVVNSSMAGSIRGVSVERGHDPREFALVAFGGAGPLHACALMREVQIGRAIVPAYPGVTSALGCLLADFRHDFVQTINRPLSDLTSEALYTVLRQQTEDGRRLLDSEGVPPEKQAVELAADMAYEGQIHSLKVPLPAGRPASMDDVERLFTTLYRQHYGRALAGFPVMVLNARATAVGRRETGALPAAVKLGAGETPAGSRQVWFGSEPVQAAVVARAGLQMGQRLRGPCIVEQDDTTTVIEPDCHAAVDGNGNLVIERRQA